MGPDATALLLGLLVLGVVLGVVFYPLAGASPGTHSKRARQRSKTSQRSGLYASLLDERNTIYAAIRELDFEYNLNKLAREDYAYQRAQLVEAGIAILRQLDRLEAEMPVDDPLEAAIAVLRSAEAADAVLEIEVSEDHEHTCSACGTPAQPDDRFCGRCGQALSSVSLGAEG